MTKIIAAFPGLGKTWFKNNRKDISSLDSDSSEFSWVTIDGNKIRNQDFVKDYLNHIKSNINKYDLIFISTHKEILHALIESKIYFTLFKPYESHKVSYLNRYKSRNSTPEFIDLMDKNWEFYMQDLELVSESKYCDTRVLNNVEYISDVITETFFCQES